jgi:O-antigen/teichoic acid export membrane protein
MPSDTPQRRADSREFLWAGEIARLLLSFAVLAVLARGVSPETLGTYLSITSIVMLGPRLLDCGLPHALGYFLRVEPAALRSGSVVLAKHVVLAAPAALALAFAVRFIPFGDDAASRITQQHWLQLALLMLSELTILLGLSSFVPIARFKAYLVTALVPPALLLVAVVLWPRTDLSAGRLLDLLLVTSLGGAAVMAAVLASAGKSESGARFPAAEAYTYGLRSYGSAVSKFAAQRFDRLFLVTVLGAAGYAHYSFAVSIRDIATMPANLYAMTLRNQQITLVAREGDLPSARALLLKVSSIWFLLGIVGAMIMYPLWSSLVRLGFGPSFDETAGFLQIIGFSCAPIATMGFAWNHFYAMQQPGRVALITVTSLLLALPTFLFFIETRGPTTGVAIAVVVWSAITAIVSFVWAISSRPRHP